MDGYRYGFLIGLMILLVGLVGFVIVLASIAMREATEARNGIQLVTRLMEQGVILVEEDEVDVEWEKLNKNGWGNGPH